MTKPIEPLDIEDYMVCVIFQPNIEYPPTTLREIHHERAIRALFAHSKEQDEIINSLIKKYEKT